MPARSLFCGLRVRCARIGTSFPRHAEMKRLLALAAVCSLALLCAACAQSGHVPSSDANGIEMYGTIDEGIAIRH